MGCLRLVGSLKLWVSFLKKALQKRHYSAKETCNLKEPTNHGHPKSIIVRLKMHPTRHPNSFSLLQRIATHRSTLQHTHPAHCNTLSHQTYKHFFVTAAHCNTHCSTLQHALQHTATRTAAHCNTLSHETSKNFLDTLALPRAGTRSVYDLLHESCNKSCYMTCKSCNKLISDTLFSPAVPAGLRGTRSVYRLLHEPCKKSCYVTCKSCTK